MTLDGKIASLVCGLGLVASVGLAGNAQAGEIRTLAELNEAIAPHNLDYSVGQNPVCKQLDRDGDGTYSTQGCLYFTKSGGRIAVSSYNGSPYAIAVDSDRESPFDYARIDDNCSGVFSTKIGTNENYHVPKCLKK